MSTKKKVISIILSLIAIACLIAACVLLILSCIQDRQAEDAISDYRVEEDTQITGEELISDVPSLDESLEEDNTEEVIAVTNPYAESFGANEDMAGWLVVPGTNIDYPVMWTPEDENYYLYRDFEKNDNNNGCLILDTDSCLNPLTTNLIIHGHNMKSGAMFGNLTDYEDEDYYNEHKQIILYTKECQRNYEIIAVFRSQVYKKSQDVFKFYKFFEATNEEEFADFYNNIKELSLYDTGVTAQFGDNFITLSTCVYHVTNGRFVVVAKEVAPGDTYLSIEE